METNILMESGTNELEVLEFIVGGNHYGINVAKIKEIVPYSKVTPVPNSHPCVEGVFMPRDLMITIVDLAKVIKCAPSKDITKDMFIITNFNKLNVAFHVASVVGIHRVSWTDIIKPDSTISSADSGIATGVVKINGISKSVITQATSICASSESFRATRFSQASCPLAHNVRLSYPDLISESEISFISNGESSAITICASFLVLPSSFSISDLEMPLMDGHRLTKLIKTDDKLKNIPVVIFSSLINDQMRAKGEALGADVQLSKPEIGLLVNEIDKLLR